MLLIIMKVPMSIYVSFISTRNDIEANHLVGIDQKEVEVFGCLIAVRPVANEFIAYQPLTAGELLAYQCN
jgi:hypothetical protein